jgi:hypothetical protein
MDSTAMTLVSRGAIAWAPIDDTWIAIIQTLGKRDYAVARIIWSLSRGHYRLRVEYFRVCRFTEVAGDETHEIELVDASPQKRRYHGWCQKVGGGGSSRSMNEVQWRAHKFGRIHEIFRVFTINLTELPDILDKKMFEQPEIEWMRFISDEAAGEYTHSISFVWPSDELDQIHVWYCKYGEVESANITYHFMLRADILTPWGAYDDEDGTAEASILIRDVWSQHSELRDLYRRGLIGC